MRRVWCRLRALMRRLLDRRAQDEELDEEIRTFLEHDSASRIRSGVTPEDARRAALIELGGAEQVKERVRDGRAGAGWESILRDLRYAMRSLGHARGFSFSVVASLSLGLAATIVAFAFINGAMLRPFPGVRDQDRLVTLRILANTPLVSIPVRTAMADYPEVFRTLTEGITSLESLAAFTESGVAVSLPEARSLQAAFVSPNYFNVLGVQPAIGRTFAPDEGTAESSVAIISHALWTREFGREPAVVGRTIQVGRQTFQIIGVAPQEFTGTSQSPAQDGVELWLPIALVDVVGDPSSLGDRFVLLNQRPGERAIRYVGRMRGGIRPEQVETELGIIARRTALARAVPVERLEVDVSRLSRLDDIEAVEIAAILLSIPFLVLVIACVNAANLFLVRASRRGREIAVRLALGASRLRVVRQLVMESLVLASGAALLALALAWSGLQLLEALIIPMPLDGTVVTCALATAFLTALAFGLVPAIQATRQQPSAVLGSSPAVSGGTRSQFRVRRVLVGCQVALSLALLATGFQLTSALESLAEPPGTDPDRLLLASFDLAQLRFSSAERDAFYTALLNGASRLPGVEAAGLSSRGLALGWDFDLTRDVVVSPGSQQEGRLTVTGSAGGDYFKVAGLDLVQGRDFAAADRREIPQVAIVTTRLASQLFNGAALGRSVHVSTGFRDAPEADIQIVGVVESPVGLSGEEVPAIFFPSPFPSPLQHGGALTLHIRSQGPAAALVPALRDLVAGIEPQVPILKSATLDDTIRADFLLQRTLAQAAALMGIVALLLASIGLYGVTSYSVATRAREFAVRIALGARTGQVVAMVLRQALTTAMAGFVLGGLAAVAAGVLIQSEVFGVPGIDLATLGGSAALLVVAMLVASMVAAWRAARLDPYAVLREE